ncbi:MAG: type II toxin-antitoxin system ParD family antitoxin [Phycisphaerae bacterium]|nr:hypothetical protein [Tepidisphaeraceae bacterium]
MTVNLTTPELVQFVKEQVDAGRYPDADAVIEAAVEQMMWDARQAGAVLTDEDVAAINESDAQIDRGECLTLDEVEAQFRERFKGR